MYSKLHYEDRKKMEVMCKRGASVKEMASELGVHRATIYNELARGGVPENGGNRVTYNADVAQKTL